MATDATNVESFDVSTPGGNTARVVCAGHGLGAGSIPRTLNSAAHRVSLSHSSLNFGNVELGGETTRSLFIVNDSKAPAQFQFVAEANGFFRFKRTDGVVPAMSKTHVDIKFHPNAPINYYRRVFCLVQNQAVVVRPCVDYADSSVRRPARQRL
jgi:cilia- and flagella-associated protein 65